MRKSQNQNTEENKYMDDNLNQLILFNIDKLKYNELKLKFAALKNYYDEYKFCKKKMLKELNKIKLNYYKQIIQFEKNEIPNIKIQHYFFNVLLNSKQFYISEKDSVILQDLITIYSDYSNESNLNSFSLNFQFENKYLSPSLLTIKYFYLQDDEEYLQSVESTKCKWASQIINPTIKLINHTKNEKENSTLEYEKIKSFFDIFQSYSEDYLDQHQETRLQIENLGKFVRNELIPKSVYYYLNIIDQNK